jgi:hypothetical protein
LPVCTSISERKPLVAPNNFVCNAELVTGKSGEDVYPPM